MTVMIWDGIDFQHVSPAEADRLVKADKAQKVAGVDALRLKYRHQFSGYAAKPQATYPDRMMQAESRVAPPRPAPEPEPEAQTEDVSQRNISQPEPEVEDVSQRNNPGIEITAQNWRQFKKQVGDALGKDPAKVTKKEVEAWAAEQTEG